jgi:hypothetical protein
MGLASAALMIATMTGARTLASATLEPAGGIVGRVTDGATGQPVAGATVAAQLIEPGRRDRSDGWGQATTDGKGRFTIGGLVPGVFNLMLLEVPGRKHATATAVEGVRVESATESTADLSVIEGRPLRGVVVDRGDGDKPVRGARVGCRGPAQPRSGQALMATETDERGRFAFHVPPGEHFVFVIDDPARNRTGRRLVVVPEQGEILPVFLLIAASDETAPATAPASKEVVVADAPLRAGAIGAAKRRTVNGRVTDPDGRPLSGIRVAVDTGPTRPGAVRVDPHDWAITDRGGRFLLDGVPDRRVWLTLDRPLDQPLKQSLPADRDEIAVTYRPQVDEGARRQLTPVEDEPIPPDLRGRLTFVDLTPYGSNFLADGPGDPKDGNNLDRVPRGLHKLRDAYFGIGDGMIHIRGKNKMDMPVVVAGIKVAARGRKLHFLHGTQQKADPDSSLGDYVIRYADGSAERIPISYGRNLIDWWDTGLRKDDLPDARIAWTGSNEMLDKRPKPDIKIGLWALTWTNPHPEEEIVTIDVVTSGSPCDPYLIAVTVERER